MLKYLSVLVCVVGFIVPAFGAISIPSDGSDGAFEPSANITVDLGLAADGSWDDPGSGNGIYDAEQWAVVFKFTSVTIPSGVTVTFTNHPSRAPVIWLVQGNVTIDGTVSLNGAPGHSNSGAATLAEPGPGGFRGGRGLRTDSPGSAGMGPGGGAYPSSHGSHGTLGVGDSGNLYGNEGIFPLIGGSGGGGGSNGYGGGAGGGAILIAASDILTLDGAIVANGQVWGGGGGSGGSIRLVADEVLGSGALSASGENSKGGQGRIRTEANTITLTSALVHSTGTPVSPPRIFREAADGVPTITSMVLNGQAVPSDPASFPTADVTLAGVDDEETVTLAITAEHVPAGSTVSARVVRLSGVEDVVTAVFDGSSGDETSWNADIPVVGGFSTIQVHAVLP